MCAYCPLAALHPKAKKKMAEPARIRVVLADEKLQPREMVWAVLPSDTSQVKLAECLGQGPMLAYRKAQEGGVNKKAKACTHDEWSNLWRAPYEDFECKCGAWKALDVQRAIDPKDLDELRNRGVTVLPFYEFARRWPTGTEALSTRTRSRITKRRPVYVDDSSLDSF